MFLNRKVLSSLLLIIFFINMSTLSYAHSGRTDSNGGHWNRSTGTYHYHSGPYTTPKPTITPTPVPTLRPTPTATPKPTITPTPVPTLRPTPTATPKPTITPTPTPTVTPTPTPTPTIKLIDIKGLACETAVYHLVDLGIVSGYPDGTYKPNDSITRAEFAKIIVIALGYKDQADVAMAITKFSDVEKSHWAAGYINIASQMGLIKGYDGKYRPEDRIRYSEVMTILLRALGYGALIDSSGIWPDNYLDKAKELNLITVTWPSVSAYASRGHVAILTWNSLNTYPYQANTTLLNLKFPNQQGFLKVHFIDVGQADSILVQAPSGEVMLVDAGNNADGGTIVSYLQNLGIDKIDVLVGTHPHEDHIGGIDTVIDSFNIGSFYMPKVSNTTDTFEDVLLSAQAKGIKVKTASAGVDIDFGSVNTKMLAPNGSSYDDLNNYSAVIKLTFGSTSFLLEGDAEDISESEMLSAGYDLKADVLKVGHHGSSSSTTQSFLKAISPRYCVISVGKGNSYGHPAQETLNKLSAAAVKIYRTDLSGTIIATSDGKTVTFDK